MNSDNDGHSKDANAEYHQRLQLLNDLISERKDISEIADLGYIDDSGLAHALQPTALTMNSRLSERKSKEELERKGILLSDEAEQHGAQRRKSKNRTSHCQILKVTPKVIWKDVKERKSKKSTQSDNNYDKLSSSGQYCVGDVVKLTKGRSGTIRLNDLLQLCLVSF